MLEKKNKKQRETQRNVVIKNKASRTRQFLSLRWTIDYYESLVCFSHWFEPQFSQFKIKTVRLLTTKFIVKDASYTTYCCYYYFYYSDDFIVIKNQEDCEWHAIFTNHILMTFIIMSLYSTVLKNKDLALKSNSITY